MRKRPLVSIVLLLVALPTLWAADGPAPAPPGADQKIAIRPTFVPGQYVQATTVEMDQQMQTDGQQMAVKMKQAMALAFDVAKPDSAGEINATLTFKQFTQSITQGKQTVSFDSANPDQGDPQLAKVLTPLTKATIKVVIGGDGLVKRVAGLDKIWNEMSGETGPLVEQLKKTMGDEMIKTMLEKNSSQLPKQPLAIGGSWTAEQDMEMPVVGKSTMQVTYVLKAIEDTPAGKIAKVELGGNLQTKGKEMDMGGAKVNIKEMTFQLKGDMAMNTANILLTSSAITMDGKADMEVTPPNEKPQAASITLKMKVSAKGSPGKPATSAAEEGH